MSLGRISYAVGGIALVLTFVLGPVVAPNQHFRVAIGDLVPLLIVTGIIILSIQNAQACREHARLFWWLMAIAFLMWWFNQASWAWFEVVLRKPLPDPFYGDVVLFLHVVPLTAAVAIRPRHTEERESLLMDTLNVLILLIWWVVVYAFVVFPDEYILRNISAASGRWDLLYVIEGIILVVVAGWAYFNSEGAWRRVYRSVFIGCAMYSLASEAMNTAIANSTYVSGGIFDVPFLISLLLFFDAAVQGRRHSSEMQAMPEMTKMAGALTPHLAKAALASLPVMAYWVLFMSSEPGGSRRIRFVVAMCGVATLAFFVFLKQHLLDRKLLQLLQQSRQSLHNLQRLHSRVVQQEKLASLGELVALAASELDYPLSAILQDSEGLAASSNLHAEQLATAQKIGQQARRTRDLVNGLLSFAQHSPSEKTSLELRQILDRAIQMESFKIENRDITVTVKCEDMLPRVLGNSNQLLQAFVQIIENAMEAMQGVRDGNLSVSIWRDGGEIVIEIADSGPGLENPEHVFDPFYTTKPVGKGTGLGLSATYGVIQDHRGQISCYNRAEGGATFEVRLPAIKSGMGMQPQPAPA